jgi:hypothetical protein
MSAKIAIKYCQNNKNVLFITPYFYTPYSLLLYGTPHLLILIFLKKNDTYEHITLHVYFYCVDDI